MHKSFNLTQLFVGECFQASENYGKPEKHFPNSGKHFLISCKYPESCGKQNSK